VYRQHQSILLRKVGDIMKKSVILIISVIYILALVLVGTSLKLAVYNPVVYVTDIEVLNEDYIEYTEENQIEDYKGYIKQKWTDGLKIELKCRAKPYDATNVALNYAYDPTVTFATFENTSDNSLIISFTKGGEVPVTVRAADGSGIEITVNVIAQRKIIV
ncbi:MAG: hypothetical protein SPK28_06650, partial [Bacilli bacterium]|nr:hypothetical protein [Bacilli bacterium]